MPALTLSRRALLLAGLGLAGCRQDAGTTRNVQLPKETAQNDAPTPPRYSDSVDALCDVLLPATRDENGNVTSPGAREARVDEVLRASSFVTLAVALGFVPPLSEGVRAAIGASGETLRTFLNAGLDGLAQIERPLVLFRDLPREIQERITARALADDRLKPALMLVRTACVAAYAGGIASDVGMRELGFPPFENHDDGLAVSGYPRTVSDGRLIDADHENLAALESFGELDDYSYRRKPEPTPGDDLSMLLDAHGDLL